MTVGERLKDLRINARKTLKEESDIFNISINTVYRWEHNLTAPRKSIMKKISDFYGVPLKWLLYGNSSGEENTKCENCSLHPENYAEQQLLYMFKKLSENIKYKILGYVERIYVENERDNS
ncbi:MAG: helix-turn-helix domain-containing protein [Oscillospiraceae bacterium]|nr:helix-turn-helix domain-containing protein [Oscillospiraceae bacterium]